MPSKLTVIRPLYSTVFAVLCFLLQLIAFILVVVGTPLDSFRASGGHGTAVPCISMWGAREKCNRVKLMKNVPYKGMRCASSEKVMTAASAFAIISIPCALLTLVLCMMLSLRVFEQSAIPGAFAFITFVSTLVCWACQVGALHRQCTQSVEGVTLKSSSLAKSDYKLSVSPALFITAWCLELFVCFLICIA